MFNTKLFKLMYLLYYPGAAPFADPIQQVVTSKNFKNKNLTRFKESSIT